MTDADRVFATLKPDELQVIRLLRLMADVPDFDVLIMKRNGRVVNVKTTTDHTKQFSKAKLKEGEA